MMVACEAACFGMLAAAWSKDLLWEKVFWFSWILLAIAARVQVHDEVKQSEC
jgi:hypothetical protein